MREGESVSFSAYREGFLSRVETSVMGESKRRGHVAGRTSPVRGGCTSPTLIPGLPNEVVLMILAQLPLALHGSFRCVCRAWKDAFEPSVVTDLRSTLHISEMWILFIFGDFMMVYDPLLQCLSSPVPSSSDPDFYDTQSRFLVLGSIGSQVFFLKKRFLPNTWQVRVPPSADIHCFDTANMQWQADPIPHWSDPSESCVIASAVVDGCLCVAGGPDDDRWGRLDVKGRKWEMISKMHDRRATAAASVVQGWLHMIGGPRNYYCNPMQSGEFWDPISSAWIYEPELWPDVDWPGKVTVLMDTLYTLSDEVYDGYEGLELFCYVSTSRHWISLGHIPLEDCACSCGKLMFAKLEGVGRELWLVLNCEDVCGDSSCRAKIWSCVPTTGPPPLVWSSIPITSSINFPPGYVEVHGNIHV